MKTWQKVFLGLTVTGTLAVLGGVVVLKILFPPERIKEIAVAKLVETLNREIKLAHASIGLGGISLSGLKISETPNFAAGTAASLKNLNVSVEWRPLILDKEVRVTDLSIDGLDLNVVIEKAKKKKKEKPGKGPEKEAAGPSSKLPDFYFAKLSVTDSTVRYHDKNTGTKASFSHLQFNTSEVTPTNPFPLKLSTDFIYDGTKGKIDGEGTVDPHKGDLDKAGITLERLNLLWDGQPYSMSGTLKPASAPAGNLTVTLPPMEAGGVKTPEMKGTLNFLYKNELTTLTKMNLKGKGASLKGAIRQTATGWKLNGLTADLEGISATLDGTYSEEFIDLRVQSKELNLKKVYQWVPALKEMQAVGIAALDVTAKGKSDAPSLSGSATLKGASLTSSGQILSKLNGDLTFTPKKVDATLKGALNGAAFDIAFGAVGYRGNHPKITLNGTLAKLDLSKLPAAKKKAAEPAESKKEKTAEKKKPSKTVLDSKGSITIGSIFHPQFKASKTTFQWNLKRIGSDLSKLDGNIAFNVGNGKFEQLKQLGSTNPMVKLVLLPIMVIQKVSRLVKVPLFPKFDKVVFKEIVGDYWITKGLMTVKKSHLDGDIADVKMTGKVNLPKDKLDLRVNAIISGRILKAPVGFKVTGTMKDPKVKLDVQSILKQPQIDKVLKQGEKLLRGLFKR
ncbi:MAG: hypothetical protein COB53_09625 [Elusimicrobia bacterium]|nr:MAG: hypothetical protein COB53_09625 [Elusimicrobiota bacterium]